MKRGLWLTLTVGVLGVWILAACVPAFLRPTSIPENDRVATIAIATVNAILTRSALETQAGQGVIPPTGGETPQPPQQPTLPPPPTSTVRPTQTASLTPLATNTRLPSTPTATPTVTPQPCDWAKFDSDISVPDDTVFGPGDSFTKTWRLKNIGTCEWTTSYALIFSKGSSMSGQTEVRFPYSVKPGESIDLSVNLVAPGASGTYIGNWKLRNASGALFGIGKKAIGSFWVKIKVESESSVSTKGISYDLTSDFCTAEYQSTAGALSCPSGQNFSNGSISRRSNPQLEGGYQDDEPALLMVPSNGSGGYTNGSFDAHIVQSGEHFKSLIGCMYDTPKCSVRFKLQYIVDGGSLQTAGTWDQTDDGKWDKIDWDLSGLAGKSVQFILRVENYDGSSRDDVAFWLHPRVTSP